MRSRSRGHGFVAPTLLIVAIIAVLGHVCVLPVHAHAVPVEGHESHGESPDDPVHTASCDAVKGTSATPSMIPAATWTALVVVEPFALRLFDTARVAVHPESPPLFLLHSSLLI
jgi:hypothetical protein